MGQMSGPKDRDVLLHDKFREAEWTAEPAAPTHPCEFFNVATDIADAMPTNASLVDLGEEPGEPSLPLMLPTTSDGLAPATAHKEESRALEESPAVYRRSQRSTACGGGPSATACRASVGPPLATQVQALVCNEASALPTGDLQSSRLLATVCGHAKAAGNLARHYACAVRIVWTEAQDVLATCGAQCKRLTQARQAYTAGLMCLSKSRPRSKMADKCSCHEQSLRCHAAIVGDLLGLEKLRCRAGRLRDECARQEWTELNEVQDTCKRAINASAAGLVHLLNGLFKAEKVALKLLHVGS